MLDDAIGLIMGGYSCVLGATNGARQVIILFVAAAAVVMVVIVCEIERNAALVAILV